MRDLISSYSQNIPANLIGTTELNLWKHFSVANMDRQNIKICFYIVTALNVIAGTSFYKM